MPNLKTLTKELRQEIVSYLYPLPSISSNLAFRLAIHIFTKTTIMDKSVDTFEQNKRFLSASLRKFEKRFFLPMA